MQVLNAITPEMWTMLGEIFVSALLLSPFMVGVKKWFNIHRELVMTLWVIGGAFVTAAIIYVKDNPDFAPWLIIPAQGSAVFLLSQVVYYALVKPLRKRWATLIAEAGEINDAKRAAVLPPDSTVTEFK
jgi:peptidoglycan/LPS O-acetylase OafA/YrhL